MKTYIFEGFLQHGAGELDMISALKDKTDFISPHDDLSQPNVVFNHYYDDDGEVIDGYYHIKVMRATTLRDSLKQVQIALGANHVRAFLSPRYSVFDYNNFGKSSVRYLSRPVGEYL